MCRLINPSKSDLGKISKIKLESINKEIRQKTKLQQWQSSREVKKWFKQLRSRRRLKFITFDIDACYPSITPELMAKAIDWGSQFVKITQTDRELFEEARRSFLFHDGEVWVKTKNDKFDVPMGAFDGAEACELVGLFLLNEIVEADIGLKKENFGLYRA